MKLNELKPQAGARKEGKRRGRGEGSGNGGTAGKGHNGARARSGFKSKRGFEGGQMPLQRRLPKRGFNSPIVPAQEVNLARLLGQDQVSYDAVALKAAGIIGTLEGRIKVIGNVQMDRAITIKVTAISEGARKAVEAAGGKVELVEA